MGGWVLATAGSNASSQVDIISRAIAIGSLVVAIGSVAVTWYLWRRSGSDLAVAVLRDSVEVSNVGRINSVVRRVYIDIQAKTRWSEGQDQMSKYVDVFDLEFPDGSEQATIPPTGFISLPIHHTLSTQFNDLPPLTWPAQSGETARAYDVKVWATAVRGDGRTYQSRAISWLFDGL